MQTVQISLNSIDKVKAFVNAIAQFDFDFDLILFYIILFILFIFCRVLFLSILRWSLYNRILNRE